MIHLCDSTDGIVVRIACDRSWIEANLSFDSDDDGREIFSAADGRLYTFDEDQVTCEGCKP